MCLGRYLLGWGGVEWRRRTKPQDPYLEQVGQQLATLASIDKLEAFFGSASAFACRTLVGILVGIMVKQRKNKDNITAALVTAVLCIEIHTYHL